MKSNRKTFNKKKIERNEEARDAGRPRIPQQKIFKLHGIKPGDPMTEPALCPTAEGQREVMVLSLQKTISGPGVAHVTLASNPLGRSYPISAYHLPEEALKLFTQP